MQDRQGHQGNLRHMAKPVERTADKHMSFGNIVVNLQRKYITISKNYNMNTLNMRLLIAALTLATTATGLQATTREGKQDAKVTLVKTTFVEGTGASGKEGSAMVADGKKWTKWCLDAPDERPYHVTLDAQKPTTMKAYALVTGEDTHNYPSRNPIAWNIYGSNDRKEWKLVEQVKYSRKLDDQNEHTYMFRTKDCQPWRYYKFEFTRMAAGTRIQLSEIEIYE